MSLGNLTVLTLTEVIMKNTLAAIFIFSIIISLLFLAEKNYNEVSRVYYNCIEVSTGRLLVPIEAGNYDRFMQNPDLKFTEKYTCQKTTYTYSELSYMKFKK